uniref:Pheromone binding protein 11 n=1 Tax=Cyrtotrachelus buqueti TaxID=1892066 RepID=A0A1L3KPS7_9CUCU|nr:pheromone binding protein 11 [Cyrtotrachelus buqueti]
MKIFVAFSAVLFVVLAEHQHEHAHQHHPEDVHGLAKVHTVCQSSDSTYVDNDVFQKLDRNVPVVLPANFGKHLLCMMKGIGTVSADGQPNVEGIKTHIHHVIHDESKAAHILRECAVAKNTPEQTSIDLEACLTKHHVFGGPAEHHHHP